MISKPRPTAAQLVRRENRWNTPFGFSVSFGLHALFIALFVSLAAGAYIESRSHDKAAKAHDIIIQTLVRQPQITPKARTLPRSVAVHPTMAQPVPIIPAKSETVASQSQSAAAHAAAKPMTSAARGRLVALAILAAMHPGRTKANKQTGAHGTPKIETVTDAASTVSAAITSSVPAPPSDPNAAGASTIDDSTGPVGRAHSGTVWSDHPPAGRCGHGGGDAGGGIVIGGGSCTPTRGGFFVGH